MRLRPQASIRRNSSQLDALLSRLRLVLNAVERRHDVDVFMLTAVIRQPIQRIARYGYDVRRIIEVALLPFLEAVDYVASSLIHFIVGR